MHVINILIAGITGTFMMTVALYILSTITKRNYKVIAILGTMITNHTTWKKDISKDPKDIFVGIISHYTIGVIFSFGYYYLWNKNIIPASFQVSTLLGILTGSFATLWWTGFIKAHPNPPKVIPSNYLVVIGASHLLFSTGVFWIYTTSQY